MNEQQIKSIVESFLCRGIKVLRVRKKERDFFIELYDENDVSYSELISVRMSNTLKEIKDKCNKL